MPSLTCHCFGYNFKILYMKKSQNLKQYFGGDIQKFSSKLPGFIWAKYKGEKHLPSYNYLGPGTRLDIRLDENTIPKPGEEPINAIDQLAYIHDLAYQKYDNISDRHEADIQMINGLKQLKNLSIPQKLIRAMIIKLFQAKIKFGQSLSRAAKTQAIENIFKEPKKVSGKNTKQLAGELHKQYKNQNNYVKYISDQKITSGTLT